MSSLSPNQTELNRLLAGVLEDTPSASQLLSTTTRGNNPRTTSEGGLNAAEETESYRSRINRLTISESWDNNQEGTSSERSTSLFVDVHVPSIGDRRLSSEDGGTQMLSARSAGTSTLGSSSEGAPQRFDIYRFPTRQEEMDSICGQRQQGGTTACIRANCKMNHRRPKIVFRCGAIAVARTALSVFIDPVTHQSNITEELMKNWLRNPRSLEEWLDMFQLVNSQGVAEVFTQEDLLAAQTFSQYAKDFRSPARAVTFDDFPFGEKSTMFGRTIAEEIKKAEISFMERKDISRGVGSTDDEEVFLSTGETTTSTAFRRIEWEVDTARSVMSALTSILDQTKDTVDEELLVLLNRSQRMEGALGQRISPANRDLNAPSVWGSIALLADTIDTLKGDLADISLDRHSAAASIENQVLKTFEDKFNDVINTATDMISQQMDEVRRGVNTNGADVTNINKSVMMLAKGANKIKDELADVRSVLVTLRNSPSDSTTTTEDSSVSSELASIKGMIKTINLRLDDVIEGREAKSIKFFGMVFRGHTEGEAWVKKNLSNDSYGLIVDAHLVLEHVFQQEFAEEGSLKELTTMYKLQIDHLTQGYAMSSFDNPIPKWFSNSTNSVNKKPKIKKADASHFDNIDSYEDWDQPLTGFRARLREQLEEFDIVHQRMIGEILDPDEPAYRVATLSVQASVSWVQSFLAYLDELYLETVRLPSFTPARSWQLTTQIGRRILLEVAAPRNGVKKLFRIGDNTRIAMVMFWPFVQCHEVMKTFKNANYRDHAVVGNEFVKFMATNSGSTNGLKVFSTTLTKFETELKELQKTNKGSAASSTTASNKMDDLKKSLVNILQRITTLEKAK